MRDTAGTTGTTGTPHTPDTADTPDTPDDEGTGIFGRARGALRRLAESLGSPISVSGAKAAAGAGRAWGQAGFARKGGPEWQFIEDVMRRRHFTPEAREWLRQNVNLRVDDLSRTSGGGYWQPGSREVRLFTAQDEAAVHELAHAWWHYRREPLKDQMIEATVRLSAERDPRYADTARLAFGYVHGIPEQNWPGMLVDRNDWEMFAGLASGTMGDMTKLPLYVRELYRGLFNLPEHD